MLKKKKEKKAVRAQATIPSCSVSRERSWLAILRQVSIPSSVSYGQGDKAIYYNMGEGQSSLKGIWVMA